MMQKEPLRMEVMRWLVIAVAVAGVGAVTAITQHQSYTKTESDRLHDELLRHHNQDVERMYDSMDQIRRNVDWLVRHQGGTPAEAKEGN